MRTIRAPRFRLMLLVAAVFALAASACEYDPTQATGDEFSHCAGVPATIGIGWNGNVDPAGGSTYYGTEGDDVVVITNGPVVFFGRGGDDLICVNDTSMAWGPELPPVTAGIAQAGCWNTADGGSWWTEGSVLIFAGDGNDWVLSSSSVERSSWVWDVCTDLGAGDDVFSGGPQTELVFGGGGSDWISTGGGNDSAWEFGSMAGQHIDCGPGYDGYNYQLVGDPAILNCEDPTWLWSGR